MNIKQIQQAHHALLASSFHMDHSGNALHQTGDDPVYQLIAQMSSLCQRIAKSKREPCVLQVEKRSRQYVMQVNQLGKEFIGFVSRLNPQQIMQCLPHHEFNPWVDAFIKAVEARMLIGLSTLYAQYNYLVINACFNDIRIACAKKQFQHTLATWDKSIQLNERLMKGVFDRTLEAEGQFRLLRFELGYRAGSFGQPPEHVQQHIGKFLDKLSKQLFANSMLGFVRKLTHSACRGYRHHLIVLVDASDRNVETQSLNVRSLWTNITQGEGVSYMHYGNSSGYTGGALGIIQLGDIYKKQQLEDAITYMVRTDYFVRIKSSVCHSTFSAVTLRVPKKQDQQTPPFGQPGI